MLMSKKRKLVSGIAFGVILAVLLVGILCTHSHEEESVREVMKDAVLHEHFKVSFFGFIDVNPGLISAYTVTAVFLIFALIVRIFFVPRFTMIPGKFQLLLEKAVGIFADLANANSPHRNKFLGAYIFTAGAYIFIGTVFELFGIHDAYRRLRRVRHAPDHHAAYRLRAGGLRFETLIPSRHPEPRQG